MAFASTASAAQVAPFRVGIVCGSQRTVRAGPQITDFVRRIIQAELDMSGAAVERAAPIILDDIDVAALNLPLYGETGIPSQIRSSDGYDQEHTRAWSRRVAALDAFVFVTPQYNWGVPAGLKNAIDHLFNEWKGKPALVVSYGGHGGDKAAAALQLILGGGLHMRMAAEPVCLTFPDRAVVAKASMGLDLGLDPAEGSMWQDKVDDITRAWGQLVALSFPEVETVVPV
ncbi:cyclic nucleotide-binding domain containing protein [Niveomyces insectorum RCEF 264]|uniref:Cyclic nucleotide-binding domain containing protein n=1 Tax=Niveomyces insectorum RCEF 264 TaxID=1081102 RepID=A0A167N8F2_9HYPO|nr:cyclic nucleotide-binding domain containing protein [Niveomyces insectorum RCEF 264]